MVKELGDDVGADAELFEQAGCDGVGEGVQVGVEVVAALGEVAGLAVGSVNLDHGDHGRGAGAGSGRRRSCRCPRPRPVPQRP